MAAHQPDLTHAQWRKSTRSNSSGQNCLEVATNLTGIVGIRDSKDPDGPTLTVSPAAWRAFVEGVRESTGAVADTSGSSFSSASSVAAGVGGIAGRPVGIGRRR
jgi:Domain of unknown function (DUF397)